MDMSRYRELFLSETREHLGRMGELLVALERAPAERETLDALFREAHSVKGMAASMGYERTAALAHHLEDALDGFRRGGEVTAGVIDRLLAGLDLLEGLLEDLQAERPERDIAPFLAMPAAAAPAPAVPAGGAPPVATTGAAEGESAGAPDDDRELQEVTAVAAPVPAAGAVFQVTVELARDASAPAARGLLILRELERAGEILSATPAREALRQGGECRQVQAWLRTAVPKSRLDEALRSLTDVVRVVFVDDRRGEGGKRSDAARSVRVRTDLLDQVVNLTGELLTHRFMLQRAATDRDWDELNAALGRTARLIDDLHHRALQARLLPLESITGRLPRLVRDLAHKTGKQVEFRLTGGGVGLDRLILDDLSDPLVHMVRNAVDHGIAAGRPGEVTIAARREKDLVLIDISDNGRGMDPDELRRQAVARGILAAEQAALLSDREALMLVCLPGFSTAGTVTDTSGRGVGMDVVKAAVEKLGGALAIRSAPGEGTTFQLRLPLSMAIIRILLVGCGGDALAIPLTRVQRTLELPGAAVAARAGRRFVALDGDEIELVALDRLLGLPGGAAPETLCLVLVELPDRRVALQVDRFLGQREAFVKPLGFPLDRLAGMSGATVEGDGSVLFIIDPHPLLEGQAAILSRSKETPDALS
ncbi:MAG: chemotaxis protein CheA [Deltaproteobacteria bacterium]|nr:MAG: chemotaxis protein CheA [Deltaproteobacteria bacterium]